MYSVLVFVYAVCIERQPSLDSCTLDLSNYSSFKHHRLNSASLWLLKHSAKLSFWIAINCHILFSIISPCSEIFCLSMIILALESAKTHLELVWRETFTDLSVVIFCKEKCHEKWRVKIFRMVGYFLEILWNPEVII